MTVFGKLALPFIANVAAFGAAGALVVGGTLQVSSAVLSDTAESEENVWDTGTLVLEENNDGQALFEASDIQPGDYEEQQCITVTYEGSLTPADVGLYAETQDDTLAEELDVTVSIGTDDVAAGPDCDGFDEQTEVYDGSLADMPDAFNQKIGQWDADSEGELRSYRFDVSLTGGGEDVLGESTEADFIWEAQVD